MTLLALGEVEDTCLSAASRITIFIAVALINRVLEHTRLPTVVEVTMITISSRITIREDERLGRVSCLVDEWCPTSGIPIYFHEDTN